MAPLTSIRFAFYCYDGFGFCCPDRDCPASLTLGIKSTKWFLEFLIHSSSYNRPHGLRQPPPPSNIHCVSFWLFCSWWRCEYQPIAASIHLSSQTPPPPNAVYSFQQVEGRDGSLDPTSTPYRIRLCRVFKAGNFYGGSKCQGCLWSHENDSRAE
jgi:hypothetical protein